MTPDHLGRRFLNLRVSLTTACNYACHYCVPSGRRLVRAPDELDAGQLGALVALLKRTAGLTRLRITGGEPLIAPGFDRFLEIVSALGFEDVSLTTNGQLLERKIPLLLEHGIRRINVSLDSLDAENFQQIARGGDLATVLRGIAQAREAGIRVKLNMVPMRGKNASQVLPLLEYALDQGAELRYIELMRMGHLSDQIGFEQLFLPMQEILDTIATRYSWRRSSAPFDSTAQRFEIPGHGFFGIIPNESEPFCANCSRLRLTAQGFIYGCLSNTRSHFIGDLLNVAPGLAERYLERALGRAIADKQDDAFTGVITVMRAIGG